MAATTVVAVFHGVSATPYRLDQVAPGFVDVVGNIRFKQADNSTKDTLNPIPVPRSGSKYSFRKQTKLMFLTAPPNQIQNLRWFSDGIPIQSGNVAVQVGLNAAYYQGGTNGDNGNNDIITINTGTQDVGITNAADSVAYTQFVPLTLVSGIVVHSTSTFPNFGDTSTTQPFLVQQMKISPGAQSGNTVDKSYVYRYDEL